MKKAIKQLCTEEREVCGVRIKMPHRNIVQLKDYERFLTQETPKNKLKFLFETVLNQK
jgi:hypothetical protein